MDEPKMIYMYSIQMVQHEFVYDFHCLLSCFTKCEYYINNLWVEVEVPSILCTLPTRPGSDLNEIW